MMRRMIICLACAAASPFVCVVITGFNAVDTCVEIKIYGAFVLNHRAVLHAKEELRATSSTRPPPTCREKIYCRSSRTTPS